MNTEQISEDLKADLELVAAYAGWKLYPVVIDFDDCNGIASTYVDYERKNVWVRNATPEFDKHLRIIPEYYESDEVNIPKPYSEYRLSIDRYDESIASLWPISKRVVEELSRLAPTFITQRLRVAASSFDLKDLFDITVIAIRHLNTKK